MSGVDSPVELTPLDVTLLIHGAEFAAQAIQKGIFTCGVMHGGMRVPATTEQFAQAAMKFRALAGPGFDDLSRLKGALVEIHEREGGG